MAKPSAALVAAQTEIAALKARLVVAAEVYHNQRAQVAALEASLNTRGVKPVVQRHQPGTVVTEYTKRDGTHWQKIRTGNTARHVQMA